MLAISEYVLSFIIYGKIGYFEYSRMLILIHTYPTHLLRHAPAIDPIVLAGVTCPAVYWQTRWPDKHICYQVLLLLLLLLPWTSMAQSQSDSSMLLALVCCRRPTLLLLLSLLWAPEALTWLRRHPSALAFPHPKNHPIRCPTMLANAHPARQEETRD